MKTWGSLKVYGEACDWVCSRTGHGGAGSSGFLLLSCQVSKHEGPQLTAVARPGGGERSLISK